MDQFKEAAQDGMGPHGLCVGATGSGKSVTSYALMRILDAGGTFKAGDVTYGGVDLTELSGTGLRDVRQLLAAHEQRLVAISADLGPKGFGPGADIDRRHAFLNAEQHHDLIGPARAVADLARETH